MPGISGLGSSCSGNLCRLTLLSWNIARRLRMRPGTLAMWPSLRRCLPSSPGSRGGGRQRRGAAGAMFGLLTTLSCLARTERQATSLWEIVPGDLIRCTSTPLSCSHGVTCYSHTVQQRHPGFRLPYCVLSVWGRTPALLRSQMKKTQCQKIKPNRYKKLATIIDSCMPGLFSSLELKFHSLCWEKVKKIVMNSLISFF